MIYNNTIILYSNDSYHTLNKDIQYLLLKYVIETFKFYNVSIIDKYEYIYNRGRYLYLVSSKDSMCNLVVSFNVGMYEIEISYHLEGGSILYDIDLVLAYMKYVDILNDKKFYIEHLIYNYNVGILK